MSTDIMQSNEISSGYPVDIYRTFIYVIIIFYTFIIFTLLSYSCMQIKHIFNNTTKYLINFLGYPGHIQDNPEDVLCCLGGNLFYFVRTKCKTFMSSKYCHESSGTIGKTDDYSILLMPRSINNYFYSSNVSVFLPVSFLEDPIDSCTYLCLRGYLCGKPL